MRPEANDATLPTRVKNPVSDDSSVIFVVTLQPISLSAHMAQRWALEDDGKPNKTPQENLLNPKSFGLFQRRKTKWTSELFTTPKLHYKIIEFKSVTFQ